MNPPAIDLQTEPSDASKNFNESPYLNARREWNERYASYIAAANNWRLIAIGSVAVALVAVTGLAWVAGQHKVVPYVVQSNGFGEVPRVQRADLASRPNENQIKAALRNWLIGARTVYVDLRAERALIDATYGMTLPGSAAQQMLSTFHRENNPYQRVSAETVDIVVHSVVPLSAETWQIDWTETTRQRSGKVTNTQAWQGTFTTVLSPPNNEAQILANPLGVYVKQFAWSTRITG